MIELDTSSFEEIINGETPALVDFWAGWCTPCKILAPVLSELSDEMTENVTFGKIDIDEFGELAAEFEISSIPTLILFKDGKPVNRLIGVQPKEKIKEMIETHI